MDDHKSKEFVDILNDMLHVSIKAYSTYLDYAKVCGRKQMIVGPDACIIRYVPLF